MRTVPSSDRAFANDCASRYRWATLHSDLAGGGSAIPGINIRSAALRGVTRARRAELIKQFLSDDPVHRRRRMSLVVVVERLGISTRSGVFTEERPPRTCRGGVGNAVALGIRQNFVEVLTPSVQAQIETQVPAELGDQ